MITTVREHISAGWDAYRAGREGKTGIARRQNERLRDIVAYARAHSAYFADRYRDAPHQLTDVTQLPILTKTEMMHDFDRWLTDPSVRRNEVEAFIADPARIGYDYLDRY